MYDGGEAQLDRASLTSLAEEVCFIYTFPLFSEISGSRSSQSNA